MGVANVGKVINLPDYVRYCFCGVDRLIIDVVGIKKKIFNLLLQLDSFLRLVMFALMESMFAEAFTFATVTSKVAKR